MPKGGKRDGAGRPAKGITKKVSLTLTAEEWEQIEQSNQPTVAAYIKLLMQENKELKNKVTQIKNSQNTYNEKSNLNQKRELSKEEVEQIWYANSSTSIPPKIDSTRVFDGAHKSLMYLLFRDDADTTSLYHPDTHKTRPYLCPNSNKNYGHPDRLVKSLVKRLIQNQIADQERELEKQQWGY